MTKMVDLNDAAPVVERRVVGPPPPDDVLLDVRDLKTHFHVMDGTVPAVDGVDFQLKRGETLGLVGESGCGKSVTALTIMRLIDIPPGEIVAGEIWFDGRDILGLPMSEIRKIRGSDMSMIFQEPMTSLNPVFTVGDQIAEAVKAHRKVSQKEAWDRALEMLRPVGIPAPERRAKQYPHELSGGMRQRVMIAMALTCDPKLLIADEPTTALDVTIQAQILELIKAMQARTGSGPAAHHPRPRPSWPRPSSGWPSCTPARSSRPAPPTKSCSIRSIRTPRVCSPRSRPTCQRGQRLNVIQGTVPNPFRMPAGCRFEPRCPMVFDPCRDNDPPLEDDGPEPVGGMLAALSAGGASREQERGSGRAGPGTTGGQTVTEPQVQAIAESESAQSDQAEVLVSAKGLVKYFPIMGGLLRHKIGDVKAVDGVSFDIHKGEVFGLVGESGCGKTTLGRTTLYLQRPTAGSVEFAGQDLGSLKSNDLRRMRRRMQLIFQDPYGSLNPRMPVSDIIGEGLLAQGMKSRAARVKKVEDTLEAVGLRRDYTRRYPHEFSGGQRQRIGIARALALDPEFIVCDEAVSALDVSIQSQILNLLLDLRREFNLTYLFIAHNLSVIEYVSDRIGVMYLGKMVEVATSDQLFREPRHPYSVALLSAIPDPDPRVRKKRLVLRGDVPSPANPPSGCRFHTRCWLREKLGNPEECSTIDPPLRDTGGGQLTACHFSDQVSSQVAQEAAARQSVIATAVADAE